MGPRYRSTDFTGQDDDLEVDPGGFQSRSARKRELRVAVEAQSLSDRHSSVERAKRWRTQGGETTTEGSPDAADTALLMEPAVEHRLTSEQKRLVDALRQVFTKKNALFDAKAFATLPELPSTLNNVAVRSGQVEAIVATFKEDFVKRLLTVVDGKIRERDLFINELRQSAN